MSAGEGGTPRLAVGGIFGFGAAVATSCAAGVEFRGRFYLAWSRKIPVAKGELLGDAVYPPCDDGDCDADADEPGRPAQVWAMRGVDPDRVVIGHLEGTNRLVVYGRLNAKPKEYFRFDGDAWQIRKGAQSGR